MVTEADWAQLQAEKHPQGVVTRRLYPHSPHDIFLAIDQPSGRRMLLLRVPTAAAETTVRQRGALPGTRGLDLRFSPSSDATHRELQVILMQDDRREVFNPLISDMAETAQAAQDSVASLTAAIDRFEQWRHLLQSIGDSGMPREARLGVFGELVILRDHLLTAMAPLDAVRAWSGPKNTNQDFQLPDAAIEVKTGTGAQPQTLAIASERQLDDTGLTVLLLGHVAIDERRGGSGESLNAIVDSVRSAAGPAAQSILDDLLVRVGYLSEDRHLYDEPRHTVRSKTFWMVTGDFPRITEAELRPGVGKCLYHISTAGLEGYRIAPERLDEILKGNM